MKIKMPAQAAKVIQTLEQHGFEAYIVGGCVRDSILGRTPVTGISQHQLHLRKLKKFSIIR